MYLKVILAVFATLFIVNVVNAQDFSMLPNMATNFTKQGIDAAKQAAQTMANLPGASSVPGAKQVADMASRAADVAKQMADQVNAMAQRATKMAQQMIPKQ